MVLVDTENTDWKTIARIYGVNGKKFQRQHKDYLSDFNEWKEKSHAKDWLIFPENVGTRLSSDEAALSKEELYTIVTNKKAKGNKGSIVAIIATTKTEPIIKHLFKISSTKRNKVKEITLEMANSNETHCQTMLP